MVISARYMWPLTNAFMSVTGNTLHIGGNHGTDSNYWLPR